MSHQGDANENHNEIHIHQNYAMNMTKMIMFGENMEHLEPSYTALGV